MQKDEFEKTILSQYSNSVKMLMYLDGLNKAIDPQVDIEKFYNEVFNLDTCGSYGLRVWGRIVAAPRTIAVDEVDYFGFDGQLLQTFNNAPFYGNKPASQLFTIGEEMYRRLIKYKAYVNIINTTLPNIDIALWALFGADRTGNEDLYTQDLSDGIMTMRIVFRFSLTPLERALLRTYGYLLRPAGVGLKVYEIPYDVFGFAGSDLQPFNQGTFWSTLIGEVV